MAGVSNFIDPYTPDYCNREGCFVCLTAGRPTRGICWKEGINYLIKCLVCEKESNTETIYHGETGFSSYFRGNFHLDGFKKQQQGNILYDHNQEHHPTRRMEVKDFRMTVEGIARRPIIRQSREGVSISASMKDSESGKRVILLNSKKKFFQPGVVRNKPTGLFSSTS